MLRSEELTRLLRDIALRRNTEPLGSEPISERSDAVRTKLAKQGLSEHDIKEAITWARKNKRVIR